MRIRTRLKLVPPVLLAALTFGAASAVAATPGPGWMIDSFATPSSFSTGDSTPCESGKSAGNGEPLCDAYQVTVTDAGSQPTDGSPVTITDTLPAGVTLPTGEKVTKISLFRSGNEKDYGTELCETVSVQCKWPEALAPDETLTMFVYVTVQPGAAGSLTNTASVSGGGAGEASTSVQNANGSAPLFGVSAFGSFIAGPDGTPDTQAGAHAYEFTTRIDLNNELRITPQSGLGYTSVHDVRDVAVDLPLGFVGSALSTPTCALAQISGPGSCPPNTRVGHIQTEGSIATNVNGPLFNMAPEHGIAAELGFIDALKASHVLYVGVVPSPAGYVLRATSREVPQVPLRNIVVTLYGNPAARDGSGDTPVAQFTNPADCSGGALTTAIHMDSWQSPGRFDQYGASDLSDPNWVSSTSESPPVTGCNLLQFNASLGAQPETTTADTPTGLTFDLKIPQPEAPGALATPPLRNASVTLPAGLTVNPSAASGLQSCSLAQVGMSAAGVPDAAPPACPEASKIGSVEVVSPLLGSTLHGSVYLARQGENPFHSLLAGYIAIDDEVTGTVVKIAGELKTNETTGQITGVFNENPQLPFSDLKLHFFGGPRGDLATPEACGTYTTTSDLMPWSAPESGPDATPTDTFEINNGCVSGFTPAFHAGTTSPQAGAFSPFTLSLGREDNKQGLGGLTVNLPTGLVGKIAGVGQCTEAQVAAAQARGNPGQGAAELASPSCPESSLLGTVTTATGPGPTPYSVTGKAYLTGPYKGAPFGLAVIVPAVAGPFDLGVVVIRQALYINPNDAHVTDVSDPFPTIRDGIPLRIKRVSVTLDRPGFTLNPTSCEVKAITGAATSTTGAQAPVSSRFQAAGCQSLPFHPEFTASTLGHTSKANGASLHVKIGFHPGQANIHKVELTIPNILPSRLTTLQKACTEAQFNTNPAGCPAASDIATAVAHTPLLPDPLSGPVYFVSHGGAAFPDTVMVLQGDNVKLIVTGHTDIKHGVTYSRFETVPDAPVSSFEFNAPEGPYSIFGANGNLCQTTISMPTTITGQNGAVLKQNTVVEPEGCPNTLTILYHKVKGHSITLAVAVPGAGKLTAAGKGLSKASKSAASRGTVTLTLKATRRGKLNTKVKLTFTPTKGRRLTAAVAARIKR